jgi:glycosyltransferase involved in cell wall biosynthesis
MAARLAGVETIVSTRHSLVAPPFDTRAEFTYNLVSLFCDWVVAICDATRDNLFKTPFARRNRITRVYNGVDKLEQCPPENHPEKRGFTLLFVGRLVEIKDLPTMVKAVSLAVRGVPDLHLWIVGHGIMREPLEVLVGKLGITEHVTFWGERLDVAHFFSGADVFTMSSVSEGLPMSLLQAMSAGLPALVTNVGGMAEVVRNAHCGLYTPVGDGAAMADAIVELASDHNRRAVFAANAKAAYDEHFTLEHMESAYMDLYRRPRRSVDHTAE